MLRELNIENVAVIERAVVTFDKGLNVLTGETGAGKSIVIDSINAILGNRTTREIVRTGANKAVIWATFSDVDGEVLRRLQEQGYDFEDMLILHREISADGKSQCRINGKPATAATVREVCASLINIHGQHDNQALLDPDKHIHILDAFADSGEDLAGYTEKFRALGKLKRQIDALSMDESEKEKRMDLLRYQIDELEKAQLQVGEDEALAQRRSLIRNSENLLNALRQSHAILSGTGDADTSGAVDMVSAASSVLSDVSGVSEEVAACASKVGDIYYALRDACDDIAAMLDSFDFDPAELERIEERLDLIYKCKRKYGATIEEILQFLEDAKQELSGIETSDEQLIACQAEFEARLRDIMTLADALSAKRLEAFERFSTRIREELSFLNMPGVTFTMAHKKGALTVRGYDNVEFLISTNPGEPAKPLSRIASGGEMSRIMLAIKNAMADKDNIGTLIFDEIDTGVSGSGAGRIGKKLRQAAETRQILCVTHSAQIAAYAQTHLKIEKTVRDERTFTEIYPLDDEQRKHELARIISGDSITETALQNAAEMLSLAKNG